MEPLVMLGMLGMLGLGALDLAWTARKPAPEEILPGHAVEPPEGDAAR